MQHLLRNTTNVHPDSVELVVTTLVGKLRLDQMHPAMGFGLVKQPPAQSDEMEARCQKAHLRELDHIVGGILVGLHPPLYVR